MTVQCNERQAESVSESPMQLFASLFLAGIETTINRLLARDPAAPSRLARMANKRLLLRFENPDLLTLITIQQDGISLHQLHDAAESDADAIVELGIDTLCELAAGRSTEQLMFDGRLAVRGDIHLLEQLRTLLMDVDVDWEEALARYIGSTPSHTLANGIKRFNAFGIRTTQQLKADLQEYAFEEARFLAGRDQLALAREELTRLQISTDRAEARIERIQRQLSARLGIALQNKAPAGNESPSTGPANSPTSTSEGDHQTGDNDC
ncbi:Ubiquinone biosynthesis accessory factor UbiJ [Halomonadaceae bacterium LMG 33818]|uniref:ubiquinone biosynthesis accessory factor UbiJ n=1 Tax=Cernens ardua TaxID=3402176 RepID=UPI003EDB9D90